MLSKKKIILLKIKKIKIQFFYYCIKKCFILLIYLSNCWLQQDKIVTSSLKLAYFFKWKSLTPLVLQTKLSFLTKFFFAFKSLLSFTDLKYLAKSNSLISLIRSPFVYKKSFEQLSYNKFVICCQTHFFKYNFILSNYECFFLKKELHQNSVLKYFFKIIFK